MWFFFSLIAILAWAGTDLFCKMGTRTQDRISHWKIVAFVGLMMGLHAVVYILVTGVEYHPINILRYLPVSALYILSMVLGYAGLRYIELSVSSPICNSSGAVAALLCFLVLGQTMNVLQLVAVGVICAGILVLGILQKKSEDALRASVGEKPERKYSFGLLAILFPILYCILDGLGTFADAFVLERFLSEDEANLSYEFTFLIVGILAYLYVRFIKKEKFNWKESRFMSAAAILETAGQFFYIKALSANAIVAAPMIASYSVFSVLLSRIVLKERLSKWQYLVIAFIMGAIAILGME